MSSIRISLIVLSCIAAVSPAAAISVNQFNVAATENFDTLSNSGTSSTLPAGWAFNEAGSGANSTYSAGTGSASTGNTFSFGDTSSSERAFGTLQSLSLLSTIGTVVTNLTGATITEFSIQYMGEQWRLGAIGRADRLDFAYSLDGSSLITGTWTDVNALDFIAPVTSGPTGLLDGNVAGNQTLITHSLTGFSLAPGASLWLRWSDLNAVSATFVDVSDDGLAIDNFSITAVQQLPGGQNVPDRIPFEVMAVIFGGMTIAGSWIQRRSVGRSI